MTENLPEVRRSADVSMLNATTDSWTAVLEDVGTLAGNIAATDFVPAGLRGSVPKVAAAILYSRELGLPPMTGLGSVHVVNGKAGLSAEAMRALIFQAGHEMVFVERSTVRCIVRGRRANQQEPTEVSYTMADAQRAGDDKKNPNYRSRPAEMLAARATSTLARLIFPDVIHGMSSVEELVDLGDDGDEQGPQITVPASEPTRKVERKPRGRASLPAPAQRGGAVSGEGDQRMVGDSPRSGGDTEPVDALQEVAAEVRTERMRVEPPAPKTADVTPVEEARVVQVVDADGVVSEPVEVQTTPISPKTVALVQMQFGRLGVTERDERLWWTAKMAQRPVTSTKDLTLAEGKALVHALERLKDRAALEDLGGE